MAGWLLFSVLWQFENSMFSLHCHGFHPLLGLDGVCDMEVCLWGHASHQGPSRNFHGAVVWNRSAWCTITDKTVKLFHLEKTEVSHPPSPFPPPEELLIPKHTQALCVSVTSSGVSHLQLSHSPGFLALFLRGFHHVFSWCLSIERWLSPPPQLLNFFAWFLYLQVVTTKKVHTWQIRVCPKVVWRISFAPTCPPLIISSSIESISLDSFLLEIAAFHGPVSQLWKLLRAFLDARAGPPGCGNLSYSEEGLTGKRFAFRPLRGCIWSTDELTWRGAYSPSV